MVPALLTPLPAFLLPCLQERKTPLHIGAQWGYEAVCKVLIDHKADVNILDKVVIARHVSWPIADR